jgi:hypothetical protein
MGRVKRVMSAEALAMRTATITELTIDELSEIHVPADVGLALTIGGLTWLIKTADEDPRLARKHWQWVLKFMEMNEKLLPKESLE